MPEFIQRFGRTDLKSACEQLYQIANQPDEGVLEDLEKLDHLLALLRYHARDKSGYEIKSQDRSFRPQCMAGGCMIDWAIPDGCLLNFNGQWLCRDHHPELADGRERPVGYQPPAAEREQLEQNRRSAREKVGREELRLLNTRIGG